MKHSILLFCILISTVIYAENIDRDGYSLSHPVHGAEPERIIDGKYSITPTSPPSDPRMCAEWESATALIIRYPLGLPWTMIETAAEEIEILCIVSSFYLSSAESDFSSHSISKVRFIVADNNTFWMRDWGPWCVFDSTGAFGISDHVYNRADTHDRTEDDQANWTIASDLSISQWKSQLRHTGGNFMTDGHGTGMSGDDVYYHTFNTDVGVDSVDALMNTYWGIDNYITFEDPLASYIDHIDCYAKFINEETIILVENGTSDDANLDQLEIYLESRDNCFGRKYDVRRINAPSNNDAAYANSIILNDRVFVPTTGYASEDSAAIALYEELMPGYEIIGIQDPGGSIEFLPTDAIHCRSKALYDSNMLYIDHRSLDDQNSTIYDYKVDVNIIPYSGEGLIPDSLRIYYRTSQMRDTVWQHEYLTYDSLNWYSGNIPSQPDSTVVEYYVTATDSSLKRECDPYPAPAGFYTFLVNENMQMINEERFIEDEVVSGDIRVHFGKNNIHLSHSDEHISYIIYNTAGMRVLSKSGLLSDKVNINLNGVKSGIYFIHISTEHNVISEKFILMK
ncbi:MAG: agmatine deiminase family protein [candidate division WOR-3 bacterium]|nr:agmatine deiminase family protein [candidate division WOR-3 bacterium]